MTRRSAPANSRIPTVTNCACLATRMLSASAADTSEMAYHPAPAITIDRSMRELASAILRNRIETFLNIVRRPEVGGEEVQQITQLEMLAASSGGCSDHRRLAHGPNGPCHEILASVTSARMFYPQNGRLKTKGGPVREIRLRSQHYAMMHIKLPWLGSNRRVIGLGNVRAVHAYIGELAP